ncbi:hypothetical protein AB9P05_07865 [Roseivirga sp. BDSF3-8]|uniref:hypothetical protein n=1 Tax=Roseivirga sp. BDSF3-8 TaxID=3241598 RepID=UPI0035325F6E
MKIYSDKNINVYYDAETPCIHLSVEGFVKSEAFRKMADEALNQWEVKRKNHDNLLWLADSRGLGALSKEDLDWLDNNWNPRAAAKGMDTMAFIVPKSAFGEMTVKSYTTAIESGNTNAEIHTQMFDSVESAKKWFMERDAAIV